MRKSCMFLFPLMLLFFSNVLYGEKPSSGKWRFYFLPEVLVRVNRQVITRELLVGMLQRQYSEDELAQMPPAQIKSCMREIINEVIDRNIIAEMLAAEKITPSPELALNEFRNNFAKLSARQQSFAMQKIGEKNLTLTQYEKKLSNDPNEQFRVATMLWAEKKFAADLIISDEQIEDYYRRHQDGFTYPTTVEPAQILIRFGTGAKERAETVLSRLRQGEDFVRLVEQFSEDEGSKKRGGNPGRFRADGTLLPEIQDAAFTLAPGSTSGIITVDKLGYVIIRLNDRVESGYLSLNDASGLIKNRLQEQILKKKTQQLLAQKRNEMKIDFYF